jgi:hypothetical protein
MYDNSDLFKIPENKQEILKAKKLIHKPEIAKPGLSDDEIRERLKQEFTSEPIDNYLTDMIIEGVRLTHKDALGIDLTNYIALDMLYRWLNNEDCAINVTGKAGKGKSNDLIWLMLLWLSISGKPFRLSNIVFHIPLFNLLLKGFKVVPIDQQNVKLVDYELERGDAIALDEASDATVAGDYSATMLTQNMDIEARMRIKQICRITSGTRRILHQSYYDIWAIERNPNTQICTGIVYAMETNDPGSPVHFLGHVKIPYVDLKLFQSYNKPKIDSVKGASRNVSGGIVSKVVKHFADELKEDVNFQKLPIKPNVKRINWLQAHDKYSIFQTVKYFKDLEALSRPDPKEEEEYSQKPAVRLIGDIKRVKGRDASEGSGKP